MANTTKTQPKPNYSQTVIEWEQLLKAKQRFDLKNRKIVLLAYGVELPITQYLIDYWEKKEKNKDKPEYIEYLDKHNELGIYMQGLAKSLCDAKLQPQKSQNN